MAKLNITIGYTDPRPDQSFINLARNICMNQSTGNNIHVQTGQLTEHNIKAFTKTIENAQEPVPIDGFARNGSPFYEEEHAFTLLIFDVKKLSKHPKTVHSLIRELKNKDCAILLLNPNASEFNSIVLKYDGTDTTYNSILSFSMLFPDRAKDAKNSTLISPLAFKRSKVAAEKMFVKKVSAHYGDLGFIKLPLVSVADFCDYALKNHDDLLVLSNNDLHELAQLFVSRSFKYFNGLSVFITTGSSSFLLE